MSLVHFDSFGHSAVESNIAYDVEHSMAMMGYTWSGTTLDVATLATGSMGVRRYVTMDAGASLRINGLSAPDKLNGAATMVLGFRLYVTTGGLHHIFVIEAPGYQDIGYISMQGGYLCYGTDSNLPSFVSQTDFTLSNDTWHYCELKLTVADGSGGSCEWKVNGVAAGSDTGIDTASTTGVFTIDKIMMGVDTSFEDWSSGTRIADLYVDTANFQGPQECWWQAADTAGSAANWTPSAGSNHQNVDEDGSDGDTTYNSASAAATLDQIAHSQTNSGTITAVQPIAQAKITAPAGSAALKVGCLSGATHNQGSARGLGSTYMGVQGPIYEVDPNTASAWTTTNLNSAESTAEAVAAA